MTPSQRWAVVAIGMLLGTWCGSSSAGGSGYGFGSFRPLDSAGQSDPRMQQSQTFTQYRYGRSLSPSPPEQIQNGGRPLYRLPQAQGYKFSELPGGSDQDKTELRFRPGRFSGRSLYAWGAGDGRWTDGTLGSAPVYRPIEKKKREDRQDRRNGALVVVVPVTCRHCHPITRVRFIQGIRRLCALSRQVILTRERLYLRPKSCCSAFS
ncbi:hypothetical protein [Candidatus Vondammii sp. HM_W22]|uniref:hypothetical protein n=1 Tax=Candidatus Vondammii sp. HM_W22 TaxID=2687299 RepID=UPI001F129B99|nr:hypothetical protein [Candidatus Vondammii sp. HM_W22]